MLGVFVLSAFTCLGHECQDCVYALECMCTQTGPQFILSVYSHSKESEPILIAWEKSPLLEAPRRVEHVMLHHAGQPIEISVYYDEMRFKKDSVCIFFFFFLCNNS